MQPNEYEFIMNSGQQRSGGPNFLQNPKNRILVSVVFVATILILVIVLFNVFANLGKQSNSDMVNVVAYQTELIRISELGVKEAKDTATRTQLSTLNSFLQTDVANTKNYLTKNGEKLEPQQLASQLDSSVAKDLESATQLNRYDETLLEIIEEKIGAYKTSLQAALQATTGGSRKDVLETAATNILVYEGVATSQ